MRSTIARCWLVIPSILALIRKTDDVFHTTSLRTFSYFCLVYLRTLSLLSFKTKLSSCVSGFRPIGPSIYSMLNSSQCTMICLTHLRRILVTSTPGGLQTEATIILKPLIWAGPAGPTLVVSSRYTLYPVMLCLMRGSSSTRC